MNRYGPAVIRDDCGGTSTRNVQRGPSVAIAQVLDPFRTGEHDQANREHGMRPRTGSPCLERHPDERRGIGDLHHREDIVAGFNGAEGAKFAIVPGGQSRLGCHRQEREREQQKRKHQAALTSPAYRIACRNSCGNTAAP